MAAAPITYDLVLLLDTAAAEQARDGLLASTQATIEKHGHLLRHDHWGVRTMAYPIRHKTEADYHLYQFQVTDKQMLNELDRSLHLADEALRFMLTKLDPGTPEAPAVHDRRASHQASTPEPAPA